MALYVYCIAPVTHVQWERTPTRGALAPFRSRGSACCCRCPRGLPFRGNLRKRGQLVVTRALVGLSFVGMLHCMIMQQRSCLIRACVFCACAARRPIVADQHVCQRRRRATALFGGETTATIPESAAARERLSFPAGCMTRGCYGICKASGQDSLYRARWRDSARLSESEA